MRYFLIFALLGVVTRGEAQRGNPGGNGSRLREQNRIAESYNLSKMTSASQILRMASNGFLVRIPSRGQGYYIDPRLGTKFSVPSALRYARPWVHLFLKEKGAHFHQEFPGSSFKVTSLVRTLAYQKSLIKRVRAAAKCKTPLTCSPHLTGSTLDISKKGMSKQKLGWLRRELSDLQKCKVVSVIHERYAFHVFVHPEFGKTPCNSASLE